jgi:hypothetical protein
MVLVVMLRVFWLHLELHVMLYRGMAIVLDLLGIQGIGKNRFHSAQARLLD